MRCENCGREEVNFHYRSNINGKITEKHLCMDCAAELGLTNKGLYRPELPLEDMFLRMFGMRPDPRLFGGFGMLMPTFFVPAAIVPPTQAPLGEPVIPADEKRPEVDEEMKKRREINILREQMHKAAAEEDYERAAALRDCIKKLEGAEADK